MINRFVSSAILFSGLLATIFGCKAQRQDALYVDPELIPYLQSFEQYYNKPVEGISIGFGPSGADKLGRCVTTFRDIEAVGHNSVRKTIFLDREGWDQLDEFQQKALLFHELGHCVLNRRHLEDVVQVAIDGDKGQSDGTVLKVVPAAISIMNSKVATLTRPELFDHYISELFASESLLVADDKLFKLSKKIDFRDPNVQPH